MTLTGMGDRDSPDDLADAIARNHLPDSADSRLYAIKEFRERTGASLWDAKEAVLAAYSRLANQDLGRQ
jgi:ribosomal protein L7/L12